MSLWAGLLIASGTTVAYGRIWRLGFVYDDAEDVVGNVHIARGLRLEGLR